MIQLYKKGVLHYLFIMSLSRSLTILVGEKMKRRILCLDGGGIKGLFAAQILADLEDSIGEPLYLYFDMFSGTSTGAIIAAGLAYGVPAAKIRDLYTECAKIIFPQDRKFFRTINRVFKSKFSNKELANQLSRIFADAKLGDCKTRLLIPSVNLTTGKVQVFKTAHAPDLRFDYQRKIVDVLLATTAAPTYLPPYQMSGSTYIDGGIGANNPSLLAFTEAISSRCGWKCEDIYLLSLGCTESISSVTTGQEKMGALDVMKLITLFMSAESQYSHNIVNILLPPGHYLRINPVDRSNQGSLDGSRPSVLQYLGAMGRSESQTHLEEIRHLFFDSHAEPFQPCHEVIFQ